MDIKQQTKNVAAQGRFGDSMLLHVNPAEVKGLASAMPLTINPETGQPEAFLPFLAPMLGSLLAPSIFGAMGITGLSAAAMSGIGAGLATYAQTGGSGSKALLSGLTAGLGGKALSDVANPGFVGPVQPGTPVPPAPTTGPVESLQNIFSGGLDEGVKALGSAAMTPTGMLASTAAGTASVMQSQEEFERMLAQLDIDEAERKRLMYERYPEQIPMADGGKVGFQRGRNINVGFNPYNPVPNLTGVYNLPARRAPTIIPRGFMPGFEPEFAYFQNINPTATDLGFGQTRQTQSFNSSLPSRRGGFGGLVGQRRIPRRSEDIMYPGGSPTFDERGPRFGRPPMFAGYGNPFMQSPTYQTFYGTPQMQQMLNPYARFVQQPMPFPIFERPVRPPAPPSIGGPGVGPTPPPNVGGPAPSPKGETFNPMPININNEFVNPVIGGPAPDPMPTPNLPNPSELPITGPGDEDIFGGKPPSMPRPNPIDFAKPLPEGGTIYDQSPETITVPIEGAADVTIPVEMPVTKPTPPMSIGGPSGGFNDDRVFAGGSPTFNERGPVFTPPIPPTPAAPANTPMQPFGIRPMTNTPMFSAPMAEGKSTNVEPPMMDVGHQPYPVGPNSYERIKKIYSGASDADLNMSGVVQRNPIPGTPEDYDKKIYLLEKEIANQFKEYHSALKEGFEEQAAARMQGIKEMDAEIYQLKNEYTNQFMSYKVKPITVTATKRKINIPSVLPSMRNMKAEGGDTNVEVDKLPEGLKAMYDSGPKGREGVEKIAAKTDKFDAGGPTDMMQDPIVQETIQFILGETDNSDIVNEFIVKYGQEQFMMLRDQILRQAAGNLNVQTEGLIRGNGNSGMADDLPMSIGADRTAAAVSQDEYIIPADVVSMLGDGSSDAGSKQLDAMLDRVRTEKTGTTKQADRINPNKVLPV